VDTFRFAEKESTMAKHPRPPEFRQKIIELVPSGRSGNDVAHEFSISRQTLSNWLKQDDLDSGRRSDGLTSAESEEMTGRSSDLGLRSYAMKVQRIALNLSMVLGTLVCCGMAAPQRPEIYAVAGGTALWVFKVSGHTAKSIRGSYVISRIIHTSRGTVVQSRSYGVIPANRDGPIIRFLNGVNRCEEWRVLSAGPNSLVLLVSFEGRVHRVRFGREPAQTVNALADSLKQLAGMSTDGVKTRPRSRHEYLDPC
jgi:transposase